MSWVLDFEAKRGFMSNRLPPFWISKRCGVCGWMSCLCLIPLVKWKRFLSNVTWNGNGTENFLFGKVMECNWKEQTTFKKNSSYTIENSSADCVMWLASTLLFSISYFFKIVCLLGCDIRWSLIPGKKTQKIIFTSEYFVFYLWTVIQTCIIASNEVHALSHCSACITVATERQTERDRWTDRHSL